MSGAGVPSLLSLSGEFNGTANHGAQGLGCPRDGWERTRASMSVAVVNGWEGGKGGARRSPKMWPVSWTQTFIKCGGLFLQVDRIEGVHVSEWRGGGKKALGPTVVESAQCAEHTHI